MFGIRPQKIVLLALLVLLVAPTVDAQRKKKKSEEQRIKNLIARNKPIYQLDTIELYSQYITIDENRLATKHTKIRRRVRNFNSINRPIELYLEFNSDLQTIEVPEASVTSKAGVTRKIAAKDINVIPSPQAESAPSFTSQKYLKINFGELVEDDVMSYTVVRKDIKSYFKNRFSDLIVLWENVQYGRVEVKLEAPASVEIFASPDRFEGGLVSSNAERQEYRWNANKLSNLEPLYGDQINIDSRPKHGNTTHPNYKDLADLYGAEANKKAEVTPRVSALAAEITKDFKSEKEQADAIYSWANKNIRYLSIILDRGGWVPHSADEIISNGYGDCKDYSTLIQSLLAAKGIKSSQVLIRSDRNYWFPDIALPEVFDHVILYIPSLDLYGDATAPNTRLGLISPEFLGKRTLHTNRADPLVQIVRDDPSQNQFVSETAVRYNDLGDVEAVSSNSYYGMTEMSFRPFFAETDGLGTSSADFVKGYLKYYGLPGSGRLLSAKFGDESDPAFRMDFEVKLANQTTFRRRGTVNFPQMLNLHNLWDLEAKFQDEQRSTPVGVGASRYSEKFTIQFPDAVRVTRVPKKVVIVAPFGSFISEHKIKDNVVELTRELVITKSVIQPSEYVAFKKFFTKVSGSYYAEIGYRTSPKFARQKRIEKDRLFRAELGSLDQLKELTARQVRLLEAQVKRRPANVTTRLRLISHYFENANSTATQAKLLNHQLWMIRNRPRETNFKIFGYRLLFDAIEEPASALFKKELEKNYAKYPDDPAILFNLVEFLWYVEPNDSIRLALIGEEKFPKRHEFSYFAFLYLMRDPNDSVDSIANKEENKTKHRLALEKGLETLEKIKLERTRPRNQYRFKILPHLSELAFESGDYERAAKLAREMILEFTDEFSSTQEYAVAAHSGNIVLGKIALMEDRISDAKKQLLLSIRGPVRVAGTTYLVPDLDLAESLLVLGERDAVIEYLAECEKLLGSQNVKLKRWQAEIKKGQTPKLVWD